MKICLDLLANLVNVQADIDVYEAAIAKTIAERKAANSAAKHQQSAAERRKRHRV